MKRGFSLRAAMLWPSLFLAACSQAADSPAPSKDSSGGTVALSSAEPENMAAEPPADLAPAAAPAAASASPASKLTCKGLAEQGGMVLCQAPPGAKIKIARTADDFYYENADSDGELIIGFDRDEKMTDISLADSPHTHIAYKFTPRDYDVSKIDGLPPSQVSTFTEAQLKKIKASTARKKVGFKSRAAEIGVSNGFIYPLKEFRKTTNFGAQRILNGEPKSPHMGVDLAAPLGTTIYAPADGVVSLADDDLYFEGAMVLLDHGQGLISMYLHVNDIFVKPGDHVIQGQPIAAVGSKGRSTGPHLCWRLKWRNRSMDPELLTQWPEKMAVREGAP